MYDLVKDSKRVLELIKEMKEAQASYQSKRLQSEEVDDNKMLMGTTAYTCWLNALGRLMRIDEVAKVFKEFEHVVREREKKDSEHSSVVGSSINHYDLIKLVHTSSTVGDIPRTEYYTWLFGEIMCQRDDPSYVKFKDSFADVGVSRCKNSYLRNFVLRAHLSRNSFASSSMQVLDNMIKDNIQLSPVTLELLIREAQRINNAKKARELLAQFIRMGIAPNNATITLLDMLMLPRDVVAILFPADGSSTEVAAAMTKYAYNRLLRNAVHAKDYTSALTVFHHMRKHYSKLDAFSYAIVVDALGQIGEVQEAEGIVSTMMAEGVRPTITVYEALVDGLVTTSRIEKGELANELMARAMLVPDMMLRPENGGITPSAAIFDTLIYACTSTNAADPVSTSGSAISWSDKALELYRKMALLKLQPSAYTKSIIESHEDSLKNLSKLSANNAFSRTTADW
ncbi:hypothetical protein GQ42DRAFT_159017 [Ramicandelaber brevisporus]|nr:hypothetical protein GQ42DRAFT_159017 [Ramicandelaber brevisporus]